MLALMDEMFVYKADQPCGAEEVEETPGDVEALVTGVATEAGAGLWLVVEAIWASTSITNNTTSSEGSDRVRSKTGKSSSR